MRNLLLTILLLITFLSVKGGDVDSLFQKLANGPTDLQKVEIFNQLALSIKNNADTSLYYVHKALDLGEKIHHPEHMINSYLAISIISDDLGEFDVGIDALYKAQAIADSIEHKELLGKIYNNLGNSYRHIGDPESSEKFYNRAVIKYKETENELELGRTYNNIGLILVTQGKLDEAIKTYLKSIKIVSAFNDKTAIANSLSNLGVAYYYKGDKVNTILYFEQSLAIEKELDNQFGVAVSLSNIGELYSETGNYPKAIKTLLEGIEIAKEVKAQDLLKHSYLIISEAYAKQKEFKTAYQYNLLYTSLKDSIYDVDKSKHALDLEAKFANSEKEKKILSLENQQVINELELTEKKQTQYFLIVGVLVVIFLLLVFFLRFRSKKKANELLQVYSDQIAQKNSEITDSITYAKRIQEAILPAEELIKSYLPNSFVLYKPKDIVAGDFYWMEKKGEEVFFAVADCTGHGVPGAMVSVVCHNAMDRAMREYKLTVPGEILDKTRELVVDQLNNPKSVEKGTITNIRDGMDIAFCVLNVKTNAVSYSGAYNPLWILRKGSSTIEEIKASRQSIGRVDNPQPYKTESIQLKKGDCIYIFSDGYADQFGGEKEKKFKSRPFKKLLVSMKDDPMEIKQEKLKNHFENWKGDAEQLDDVCVIGVRV